MKTSGPVLAAVLTCGGALLATALAVSSPGAQRPWTLAEQPAPPAASAGSVTAPAPDAGNGDAAGADAEPTVVAPAALPAADPTWIADVAAATAIPPVAVAAYARADLVLGAEQPGCHVGWTTLAAIGNLESGHGTHGGAVLGDDGRSSIPVIGPALNGAGVAAIAATPESTAWHGDPVWDHAIGPMQFLPSSWERWGTDADADGVADPHDIDDAALAAARYLCAGGADLATAEGWHRAVLSYNHSEEYVAAVLSRADAYAGAAHG